MSTGSRLLVEVGEALYGPEWLDPLAKAAWIDVGQLRKRVAGVDEPYDHDLSNRLKRLVLRESNAIAGSVHPLAETRRKMLNDLAHRLMALDWEPDWVSVKEVAPTQSR